MSRTEFVQRNGCPEAVVQHENGGCLALPDGGSAARDGTSDTTRLVAAGDAFAYISRYAELFGNVSGAPSATAPHWADPIPDEVVG
jgi:hypothetical protein